MNGIDITYTSLYSCKSTVHIIQGFTHHLAQLLENKTKKICPCQSGQFVSRDDKGILSTLLFSPTCDGVYFRGSFCATCIFVV